VIFLSALHSALAQQFQFENLTSKDGILSNECYGIVCDQKGYVWIRTHNGIIKYNGDTFKKFTLESGLKDLAIYASYLDSKGRIWFATASCYIGYIENDQVHYILCSEKIAETLGYGQHVIYKIILDEENNIFVGTTNTTFKISSKTNYQSFEILDTHNSYFEIIKINNQLFSISGDYTRDQSYNVEFLPASVLSVPYHIDWNARKIGIGLKRHIHPTESSQGVVYFNCDSILYSCKPGEPMKTRTFKGHVNFNYIDNNNNLWVGVNYDGVYCYLNSDFDSTPVHSLAKHSVSHIQQDFEGNVWCTTLDKGVFICRNIYSTTYDYIPRLNFNPEMLSVAGDYLFISDYHNSLIQFDINKNTIREEKHYSFNSQNAFHSIHPYQGGYVVSSGSSVFKIDSLLNHSNTFITNENFNTSRGAINTIVTAENHIIGISSTGVTDYQTGIFVRLRVKARNIALFNNKIYLATFKGLHEFVNNNVIQQPNIDSTLKIAKILSLNQKLILVSRENGLFLVNKDLQVEEHYLGQCVINDACAINNALIAVSTNEGIYAVNLNTNTIQHYDRGDGIYDREVLLISSYKNRIFYSTLDGISCIDILNSKKNLTTPKLEFISAAVNDSSLFVNDGQFPFASSVEFIFDKIAFRDQIKPVFYYRLSNGNGQWKTSSTGKFNFYELNNGDYTFDVYLLSEQGVKSEVYRLAFSIEKPIYKTAWFILLMGLILSSIVVLVAMRYNQYVRAREEEKTRINKLMSEYQLMGLKAQMNPHFIFNCLNSIQRFVLDHDTREAYAYIAKFSRLIRKVLDNSENSYVPISDEIELLDLYIQLESLRFEHQFDYSIEIDPSLDTHTTKIPSLLLQPYVENSIWHGLMNLPKDKKGELKITLKMNNDNIEIHVTDNGIGREASKKVKVNKHVPKGMSLNQKRLEAINHMLSSRNASIVVKDRTEGGTEVIITLPSNYEE
jgi:sensor histidine kinase YesM